MPSAFPPKSIMKKVNGPENLKLEVDVNHNPVSMKRARTPSCSSPNPLDNEILKQHSPGLSAFGDYVDLVKRHLMYAVREEVEILKQQIVEMMDKIGQLEYENSVLKSEAKPETLNKLLQSRVAQTSQTVLPGQTATTVTGTPSLQQAAPHTQSSQPTTQITQPKTQTQPSQSTQVQPTSQKSSSQVVPTSQQTLTSHTGEAPSS